MTMYTNTHTHIHISGQVRYHYPGVATSPESYYKGFQQTANIQTKKNMYRIKITTIRPHLEYCNQ